MTHWSLLGRRILGIGPDLAPLARSALFGAALEIGDLSRLADLLPGSLDLLLIDADSVAPDQLAAALTENAVSLPPVLLLGQSLDARLVRCLMRLPLSDVLTAPYDDAQLQAAIYGLLDGAFSVPAAPAGNRRSQVLAVMGAVGQPRDGHTAASYALLDTSLDELTYHRVPYDVPAAAAKIRAAGLPEALADRLERGR